MKKYDAVIFDFFGTLSEQNCAPEDSIIEAFKLYQKPDFSYEFVEDVVCGTACEIPFTEKKKFAYYQTLIDKLGLPEDSHDRLNEILNADIAKERLIEGAVNIVNYIKDKGYKLGMISDLPNPNYDFAYKLGFADRFDFRHLSFDPEWVNSLVYERVLKPDLAVFKRTLSKLGSNTNNTVMIGNSLHSDIEPARKLEIRAILVDYKNKYPNDRDRIESLEKLREIL